MNKSNNMTVIIAGLALIIATWILGSAIKNRNKNDNTISVTGLGKKDFTSDLVVWSGTFSRKSFDLKEASSALDLDRTLIKKYLISKGIPEKNIVFTAVSINKDYETEDTMDGTRKQTFTGFSLNQAVQVESTNVNKVENVSREVSELINNGVEFSSNPPEYYYTKLSELKLQMIAEATKDAKQRAEKMAENAGADLGNLKKADMGVFQIIAQNSSEDYSWGGSFNTSAKNKTANITVKLVYEVD